MRFAFGANWQSFSRHALTPARAEQARAAFRDLLQGIDLAGTRFLDIGFGQGLGLVAAAELGANVLGVDVDADNLEALRQTQAAMGYAGPVPTRIVSILDDAFVEASRGHFDVVHSWGVLHHTGSMWEAIDHATQLVAPNGHFICSIYNRHWSSPLWSAVKWLYNALPPAGRRLLIRLCYPVIYLAKWLVTGRNPRSMERGMDFMHDVVDWVGGYPYEYASAEQVRRFVEARGFDCLRTRAAGVPTGCNEFVFRRRGGESAP